MFVEVRTKSRENRPFQINVGLEEGYGSNIKHYPAEVLTLVATWMENKMRNGEAVITGLILYPALILYGWNSASTGVKINHENMVALVGNVNPLYSSDLTDEQVILILRDLASFIGESLNQTRMYVTYKDEIRIYQNDKTAHPTEKKES